MRTLAEILDAAKVGEPVTPEESLYALLAVDALTTFDDTDLFREVEAVREGKATTSAEHRFGERFKRWKRALAESPKDWLGPDHDPARPEVAARVRSSRRLVDKIAGGGV